MQIPFINTFLTSLQLNMQSDCPYKGQVRKGNLISLKDLHVVFACQILDYNILSNDRQIYSLF